VSIRPRTIRRLVAPILNRNQILKYADSLLALKPKTHMPTGSKSGIWYMAFAKMGKQFIFKVELPRHFCEDEESSDEDELFEGVNDDYWYPLSVTETIPGQVQFLKSCKSVPQYCKHNSDGHLPLWQQRGLAIITHPKAKTALVVALTLIIHMKQIMQLLEDASVGVLKYKRIKLHGKGKLHQRRLHSSFLYDF
jgi:hypothetical protein